MDYKKDIQQRGLVSQRSTAGIEAFSITLSKKCERLATAIYLVTNFLSDTEPLKARLRSLTLDFVRDASALRIGSSSTEASVFDALRGNIGETLALLELAFIAGLISEMNFTILKREYASLRDSIDIKKASRESHTDSVLGDTFFGTSFREEERIFTPRAQSRTSVFAPAPAQKSPHQMSDRNQSVKNGEETAITSTPASKTHQGHTQEAIPSSPRATTDVAKEGRRTRILKLIKDSREVAIKDIVAYFPDLSEKTIQRELVAMSDSGVLKKSGERRWSRYSVA